MPAILELDITLSNCQPKIWRRIHIPSRFTFHELHYAIQFAMGWHNAHLYQFIVGRGDEYIRPPMEDDWGEPTDARKMPVGAYLAAPKDSIVYEYDFGDSWSHLVTVKKLLEATPGQYYPVVTDGAKACPPEDCGGVWGYMEMLETLKKPRSKAYKEWMEWIGEPFDPEAFDREGINRESFRDFHQNMAEADADMPW